jgi:antitoxin StbD
MIIIILTNRLKVLFFDTTYYFYITPISLTNQKNGDKIVLNKIPKRIFIMTRILANYTTSISELKKSPSSVIENANGESIAILNHNKPSAYLVPSDLYENMMEMLDEYYLMQMVKERLDYKESDLIEVSLDEL